MLPFLVAALRISNRAAAQKQAKAKKPLKPESTPNKIDFGQMLLGCSSSKDRLIKKKQMRTPPRGNEGTRNAFPELQSLQPLSLFLCTFSCSPSSPCFPSSHSPLSSPFLPHARNLSIPILPTPSFARPRPLDSTFTAFA